MWEGRGSRERLERSSGGARSSNLTGVHVTYDRRVTDAGAAEAAGMMLVRLRWAIGLGSVSWKLKLPAKLAELTAKELTAKLSVLGLAVLLAGCADYGLDYPNLSDIKRISGSILTPEEQEAAIAELANAQRARPYDLQQSPLQKIRGNGSEGDDNGGGHGGQKRKREVRSAERAERVEQFKKVKVE